MDMLAKRPSSITSAVARTSTTCCKRASLSSAAAPYMKIQDYRTTRCPSGRTTQSRFSRSISNRGDNLAPGAKLVVSKLGGHLLVDGHPVQEDIRQSPGLPLNSTQLLFIDKC